MTTPSDGARALHERVSALFAEIRVLRGPERAAALDAIANGTVRAEVESLLRYDEPDTDADPIAPDAGDAFPPGMAFGPYRVVRRLGRGATGVVLLGEQTEPVRRRVAIKLVPQAMLDAAHAARFDFERRALERTEHPGIPAVLDAGRTAQGLPYIVMEFVDGEPITAFCERHGLGVVERIGLVVAVAGAVQHAHQRGLIHRDLKPGNILVGGDRADPRPKVVDFGIARGVEAGDSPTLTLGRPIGTLAYMPPEQAFGGVVDTRADIYALGAVLYELAAGRPPLVGTDANEALDQIRVGVPAPASRVRRDAPIPGDRTPATLWADLDRVLACALEKSPARRYATAEAFAEDLQRVVRREPVNARPQSAAYRLSRLMERNKAASAAAALAVVAVGVGVAGLGVGYAEAERQRALADERAETLGAVNRFLIDDLLAAISPDEIAADTPAVVLLDRAAKKIDGRFPDRPLLAAELHYTLGRSYTRLSAFDQAERALARATSLAEAAGGDESPQAVRSRLASASLLASRQRFEEALAAYETLLPLGERVLGPDDPAMHMAWNDAGVAMDSSGRHAEGEALLARALDARRRTLGPDDPQVLLTLSNLAQARDAQGDGAGALELMLEAARVAGAMPDAPTMLVIGLHNNIGATYLDLGRPADAAPHLEKASALAQDWFGPDDPTALILLSNLASLRSDLGDAEGAIEAFGRVVAGLTALVGPEAYDTLIARQGLWTAHLSRGDAAGAEAGFAELVAGCERGLGADHWLTAACLVSHAKALQSLGRLPEARAAAARGHGVFLAVLGPEHSRTSTAGALVAELDWALAP